MSKYLTGQLVVVYGKFIGRVTNECEQGVWVQPLINKKPDTDRQDHHSCYSPGNVKSYNGESNVN